MSPMNNRRMTPTQEPGILDFAPGAAAAYSLRKLSLSYNSPVVTVRRSTDSAEADFTAAEVSDGTLAAWCGAGDGFVKQWWDQSWNARHATQATTTAQPQIVDSGVLATEGGKATVDFSVGHFLESQASWGITGTVSRSIFLVTAPDDIATSKTPVGIGDNSTSTSSQMWNISVEHAVRVEGGNEVYGGGALNELQAVSHIFSGTNVTDNECHVDGARLAAISSSPTTVSTVDTVCRVGRYGGSATLDAAYYNGRISELLIYPTDQTALRTRIEGNIAWYY